MLTIFPLNFLEPTARFPSVTTQYLAKGRNLALPSLQDKRTHQSLYSKIPISVKILRQFTDLQRL